MNLKIAPYSSQIVNWPSSGKHILGQYDDQNIIVYQAFNTVLAKCIVDNQNFHSVECIKNGYSFNRMSWIKTNFLWMMFRSGWSSKLNQERILAIKIRQTGFEDILREAIKSSAETEKNKTDQVRLQWDPDHNPDGSKVNTGRRAIQLGLRGDMLRKFSTEYIVEINDITPFVLEQSKNISNISELIVPIENVYIINDVDISNRIYS